MLEKMKKSRVAKPVKGTCSTVAAKSNLPSDAYKEHCRQVTQLFTDMEESRNDRITAALEEALSKSKSGPQPQ